MARAAIDIGSNSLLLTVVDAHGIVLHDSATVVGLGRGMGDDGAFTDDRMVHAAQVLRSYVARASELGVATSAIRAVATSAARRAPNAQGFFDKLRADLGLGVAIISGPEEARLTFLGAVSGLELPEHGRVLVVDLGGGSTELAIGEQGELVRRASLELGVVRLTEKHLGYGAANDGDIRRGRDAVRAELSRAVLGEVPRLVVAVAGTATTLAAIDAGVERWTPGCVGGRRLKRSTLRTLAHRFATASPTEREVLAAVSPKRAPYLLAGAVVLAEVLDHVGARRYLVSERGLRFGVLAEP